MVEFDAHLTTLSADDGGFGDVVGFFEVGCDLGGDLAQHVGVVGF